MFKGVVPKLRLCGLRKWKERQTLHWEDIAFMRQTRKHRKGYDFGYIRSKWGAVRNWPDLRAYWYWKEDVLPSFFLTPFPIPGYVDPLFLLSSMFSGPCYEIILLISTAVNYLSSTTSLSFCWISKMYWLTGSSRVRRTGECADRETRYSWLWWQGAVRHRQKQWHSTLKDKYIGKLH